MRLGLALAIVFAGGAAFASNGAAPISVSGRAAGRGGADAALSDDALSVLHNPAGMLRTSGWRLDIQDTIVVARDRFTNDLNDEYDVQTGFLIPALGAIYEAAPEWRLGLALAFPFGASGEKEVRSEIYPEGETERIDFFDLRVGPAVAWRPAPDVYLGLGLFYNLARFSAQSAATTGSSANSGGLVRQFREPDGTPIVPPRPVTVEGEQVTYAELFSLASTPDANAASLFELSTAHAQGISASLGVQWDPAPYLSLGLAYSTPAFFTPLRGSADIDGDAALERIRNDPDIQFLTDALFESFLPDGAAANFRARYDYEIEGFQAPQWVSAGLALRPRDDLLIAADFRWVQWSKAFDSIDVALTGGDNPNINEVNGGDAIETSVKLAWKDIYIAALGASWAPADWLVLRAGYNYSTSPIRKNRATPSPPVYEHHVAGGFTAFPTDIFGVTAAIVYAPPAEAENEVHPTNPAYSFSKFKTDILFVYVGVSFDL